MTRFEFRDYNYSTKTGIKIKFKTLQNIFWRNVVGAGHCKVFRSISKRGDTYLRTLLIHGARSVLAHAKEPGPWLEQIKARRPANLVIVAQAAKTARTNWAVTAKEQDFQRGFQSVRPLAA